MTLHSRDALPAPWRRLLAAACAALVLTLAVLAVPHLDEDGWGDPLVNSYATLMGGTAFELEAELSGNPALRAGAVFRELRSAGAGIEVRDAMQAGICLEAQVPLVVVQKA